MPFPADAIAATAAERERLAADVARRLERFRVCTIEGRIADADQPSPRSATVTLHPDGVSVRETLPGMTLETALVRGTYYSVEWAADAPRPRMAHRGPQTKFANRGLTYADLHVYVGIRLRFGPETDAAAFVRVAKPDDVVRIPGRRSWIVRGRAGDYEVHLYFAGDGSGSLLAERDSPDGGRNVVGWDVTDEQEVAGTTVPRRISCRYVSSPDKRLLAKFKGKRLADGAIERAEIEFTRVSFDAALDAARYEQAFADPEATKADGFKGSLELGEAQRRDFKRQLDESALRAKNMADALEGRTAPSARLSSNQTVMTAAAILVFVVAFLGGRRALRGV